MTNSSENDIRRRARLFSMATTAMAIAILAAFAVSMGRAMSAPASDIPELPILYSVYWLPTLFYLWALIAISRTFGELSRGALFGPVIAKGLTHLGWALLVGGVVNAITLRVVQSATLPSGFSDGDVYAFKGIKFDAAHAMLVLVAIAILLLARLIHAAAEYRTKTELLEAELDEFI